MDTTSFLDVMGFLCDADSPEKVCLTLLLPIGTDEGTDLESSATSDETNNVVCKLLRDVAFPGEHDEGARYWCCQADTTWR